MKNLVVSALGLVAVLAAAPAMAQSRHAAPTPALSQAQAQAIAVARVPGTVRHAELENEHHRWIYSFEIESAPHTRMEVNIDANTGAVVEVSRD